MNLTIEKEENIIQICDVSKSFKDVKAVNNLSLDIAQGEYVALLGPNGAGKTTLVEMIEGLQKPDKGEILISNRNWNGNREYLHRLIGISLQENRFIDKLTVRETLKLFASFYGYWDDRVEEIIDLVRLDDKKKTFTQNLSGGQKQRLALGLALINNPKILLLDEPTTGLDPNSRREIWNILLKLKKEFNTTLILTTHYMEEASYLCQTIVIMDNGKILAKGTLEELLSTNNVCEIIEYSLADALDQPELENIPGIKAFEWDPKLLKGRVLVFKITDTLPLFIQYIDKKKYSLKSLECRKMTLEDLFISMTGRRLTDE